jgi:aspartyl protease family protein
MRKGFWLSVLLLAAPAWAGDPNIVVVGLMGDRAIMKVDGQQMMLRPGEVKSGVELISVNSREAVLKVNGHQRNFELGMDTSAPTQRITNSIDIPMTRNGQYLTDGFINGKVADFLVDTGANSVSLTTAQAEQLGLSYRQGRPALMHNAGNEAVRGWVITLDSVRVGPIVVHDVQATVREAADQAPILLGMSFLSEVTVKQERGFMRLTER